MLAINHQGLSLSFSIQLIFHFQRKGIIYSCFDLIKFNYVSVWGFFWYLLLITYVWHRHHHMCFHWTMSFFQIIIGVNVSGVCTSELVTNNYCLKNWTERLNNEVYSFERINRSCVFGHNSIRYLKWFKKMEWLKSQV